MKKTIILFLIIFFGLVSNAGVKFLTQPSLSPDGKTVYFSYEGDIWKFNTVTKNVFRLTALEGIESNPIPSPDGKWLAFSGREEGNANVYILPLNGGKIIQLTYNDANDLVESWSWDSKKIYFTSNRFNTITSFSVSLLGGTPKRLFAGFFNRIHNLIPDPNGSKFYFNETLESIGYASRKRYKGDYNPDIKSFDIKTKEFKKLTKYDGKDLWPTIDKKGNLFFASDEANGEYNLYTFKNGVKSQLTDFSTSIGHPFVNVDGTRIIFEKDYSLFLYDVRTEKYFELEIPIPTKSKLTINRNFSTSNKITNFDVSSDNKKIAFVSRGVLFVSDIEGKFIKKIKTEKNERVVEVNWLKDNKSLLFTQTNKGWKNLFFIDLKNESKQKQITNVEKNIRSITFNKDKTKALYLCGRDELHLLNLKNYDDEIIVKDEFWALNSTPAYFSPNGKYIVYNAIRDFEEDIFVYEIDSKRIMNITKTGVSESSPVWSPDGKYIYFASDKLNPTYPRGPKDVDIFRIPLQKFDKEFKSDYYCKLFSEKKKTAKDKSPKESSNTNISIDYSDLNKRWENVVGLPLNQYSPVVVMQNKKQVLLFASSHDGKGMSLWKKTFTKFDRPKTEKIQGSNRASLNLVVNEKAIYTLAGGTIAKINLQQNKIKKINISYNFEKNLKEEFDQMFYETYANVSENFYDEKFHGENFEAIKNHYKQFLPFVTNRNDLRRLLRDLLGELNSSHQNFYSNGPEEKVYYSVKSAATGILFDNDKPYSVKKIIKFSPADKSHINLKTGDLLVAVNDVRIDFKKNREMYFNFAKLPDELKLTFKRGKDYFNIKIHPTTTRSIYSKLYNEWEENNQKYIDKKSNNKIAYIHMKDMGGNELEKFIVEITNELHYRDGLILDLRYNNGGNVHNDVLQLLSQRAYTKWKYREGKFAVQPNFTPADKPIVLLINAQSLSDAEMTGAGFKELKLGDIVGTESYRWLIFTSGGRLVDGSSYRLPSWGCYYLDGKDIEFEGVKPDYYVDKNFVDRIENKMPQLDKAIELILKKINH